MTDSLHQLIDQLRASGFDGDIETAYAERVVAATDNSIYQLLPQAILYPRRQQDIAIANQELVRGQVRGVIDRKGAAHHHGVPRAIQGNIEALIGAAAPKKSAVFELGIDDQDFFTVILTELETHGTIGIDHVFYVNRHGFFRGSPLPGDWCFIHDFDRGVQVAGQAILNLQAT